MLLHTQGWAVADPDGINIKTVSETRRAAIVNWLVVEKGALVTREASDEDIENAWRHLCGPSEVMEVTVQRHL